MIPRPKILAALLCAALPAALSAHAAPKPPQTPGVWMMPPNQDNGAPFRELFEHPEQWQATRQKITVLAYADHVLAKQFTDAELRAWMPQLRKWGLKFGMEVGALKRWGPTGDAAFAIDKPRWDRFIADGAPIIGIAMDEPLAAARKALNGDQAFAVEQVARFMQLVRQNYPSWVIGDIEPHPGFMAAETGAWIDALQARLRQMHVRGLDFFRTDVNWGHFRQGDPKGAAGWPGLRQVEDAVHARGLPYSLIYWAADLPALRLQNRATDQTWEDGVMFEAENAAHAGVVPDEWVIESWVGAPSHAVPETQPGTFTRSVLDFTARYVPGG